MWLIAGVVVDVAVTLICEVPFCAPRGTARVIVTLAVSLPESNVTDVGLMVSIEPGGPPLPVKLIVPVKPDDDETVTVKLAM